MGNYDWQLTDRAFEDQPQREDVGTYPGMRPMSEAPHDRMIIGILADVDEHEDPRAWTFHTNGPFGSIWCDADDGAHWWYADQFLGWLPVPSPTTREEAES